MAEENKLVFELSKIPEPKGSQMHRLSEYQEVKKMYFQCAQQFQTAEMTKYKFYKNFVKPRIPETVKLTSAQFNRWAKFMEPYLQRLMGMYSAASRKNETKTLLEQEREKLIRQVEIRQDVTEVMHSFVRNLKTYLSDEELFKSLSQKEILDLYKVIREEEDRAKLLTLKERAEDRADNQFAWFVSQAKAGILDEVDMEFLTQDIKEDLAMFRTPDGSYALPSEALPKIRAGIPRKKYASERAEGTIPKVELATEALVAQPNQVAG